MGGGLTFNSSALLNLWRTGAFDDACVNYRLSHFNVMILQKKKKELIAPFLTLVVDLCLFCLFVSAASLLANRQDCKFSFRTFKSSVIGPFF